MTAMTIPTAQTLLDGSPAEACAFLYATRHLKETDFNWLLLAQGAGGIAQYRNDPFWARIAIQAYRRWADTEGGPARESARQSTMMLRAYFVRADVRGAARRVGDLQRLMAAFNEELPLTLKEARELSRDWQHRDRATMLNMRTIKNRLASITLIEPEFLKAFPTALEWLALRDDLP